MTLLCSTGKGTMRLLDRSSLCNLGSMFRLEKKPALAASFAPSAGFTNGQLHCPNDRRDRAGLEVQLSTKLISARVRYDAVGVAEGCNMRQRRIGDAGVVASQIVVIERVEDVEREANGRRAASKTREILAQPHVDALVRERARYRVSTRLEAWTKPSATDVDPLLATERRQARPLNAPQIRDVSDPVPNQAILLVV